MAQLTGKARSKLRLSDFAGPKKTYPIEDISHARNALARAAGNASSSEASKIRAAVHAKFPSVK